MTARSHLWHRSNRQAKSNDPSALAVSEPTICQFFVYGTLKRTERNESAWPVSPTDVQIAWVRGRLYGHRDYPAMKPGLDRVLGELWRFDEPSVASVIRSLDQLEGTHGNSPSDLYHRHVVETFDLNNRSCGKTNTYFYVRDPIANGFHLIEPNEDDYAAWPEVT